MGDLIFIEKGYKFDFTKSTWAKGELQPILTKAELLDVDFIYADKFGITFVEYKNATVNKKALESNFNPLSDKKISDIVRKFHDSLIYLWACNEVHPVNYVYILEYVSKDDSIDTRQFIRNKIAEKLPFSFQKNNNLKNKMINDFYVITIDEWNNKHPEYPVVPLAENIQST